MSGFIGWLTARPPGVLYLVMAVIAAVENVFPPVPADTVVAFGSWLAARGEGAVLGAFLATWFGNVAGAAGMYVVGRRHGAGWMQKRIPALADDAGEKRVRALYKRYGMPALIASRFIPGVRALVPPVAGALRIPALPALGAMAIASAVWYGLISYLAFTAGDNWAAVQALVTRFGIWFAVASALLLAGGALVWYLRARRPPRDP